MNLGKYIKSLLLEHETAIFPGLGAFISTYHPAQMDEEHGIILPPAKEVKFNSRIKTDDGLLMQQISVTEDVSNAEAKRIINQELQKILYQLDKGEQVILRGLGILYQDENQEIIFELQEKDNLLTDAFGLEPASLWDEKSSIQTEEIQLEKEEEVPAIEEFNELQEIQGHSPEPQPDSPPDIPPPIQADNQKEKKKLWPWILAVLLLMIAAGLFFLIHDHNKQSASSPDVSIDPPEEPVKETLNDIAPVVPVDTLEWDSASVTEKDTMEVPGFSLDSTAFIIPVQERFYLIGGSFTKASNAEKFFLQMKKEGYEPYHLGKKGKYFLVGIDIFDNKTEAFGAQYNYLDKFPDSGVWVYTPE
ncbi:MAG: HU family DNA-binding protein [Mariniphaga sp.]|nr:hypothetical protein [Mariniphaga sp.]MDD4424739.1 hypothetical protein [Mariniphaga sp.]